MSRLTPEVISLVHHVELHESSWWEDATDRIIQACLIASSSPVDAAGVQRTLVGEYGLHFEVSDIGLSLRRLESAGLAIEQSGEKFSASQEGRNEGDRAVRDFENLERAVAKLFDNAICEQCGSMPVPPTWADFLDDCLIPLLSQEGAQAASLSLGCPNGNGSVAEVVAEFVNRHDPDGTAGLAGCIQGFIASGDNAFREYILRQLDAQFIVVAAGLDSETIKALTSGKSKKLQLGMVLDTNFLFSVLGWHDNPSNEAARSLLDLAKTAKTDVDIQLLVLPTTIEELQHAVSNKAEQVENIRWTKNLAEAALEFGVPGLVAQYLASQAKSDFAMSIVEYADFLSHDIETTLQNLGVMSVYEDTSALGMRQDVIDSINDQMAYEVATRSVGDRRDYRQLRHDMIAYHWVGDQRPQQLKTAVDAGYWLVTLDFRLLGFDRFRCRGQAKAQVCLHPSTAIQLMKFWVPRSEVLEAAMFSSVRQPLFPTKSLLETEKVTYRIIERLGTLDGIEEISTDAIRDALADRVLQKKMKLASGDEQELELIEAAFVRIASDREQELAEERRRLQLVESELQASRDAVRERDEREAGRKVQVERLKKQVAESTTRATALDSDVKKKAEKLEVVEQRLSSAEEESARLRWLLRRAILPGGALLVLSALVATVLWLFLEAPQNWIAVGLVILFGMTLWFVWMSLGLENEPAMKDTKAGRRLLKTAAGLKVAAGAILFGLVVNVISYYWMQPK